MRQIELTVIALFALTEVCIFTDGVAAAIMSLCSFVATCVMLGIMLQRWDKKH
jgi:hypothetical protein